MPADDIWNVTEASFAAVESARDGSPVSLPLACPCDSKPDPC
ncbi:MAG: hypothetical protein R3C10_08440 [Pirellulales bacterium]